VHTNPLGPEDRLNDLERRLSAWQPSAEGLDADRMLFAAGRASARAGAGRFAWPALAACFALTAAALGGWLAAERAGRQELARLLRQQPPARPLAPEAAPTPAAPPPGEPMPPSVYLAARRALEHGVDAWPPPPPPDGEPQEGVQPGPPVLQVWQRDRLFDL
jgi:hypothetical protein